MKLIQFLLLIWIATLISCNAVDVSGTSSDIDIELIGVASIENQPIANATVRLSDEVDSSTVAVTLTDDEGVYRFDSVTVGSYYLTADMISPSGDSLLGSLGDITVESGDTVVDLGTLWMQRPGAIKGYVNLNGGTGDVLVFIPGTSYDARTDSIGYYEITGIYPDSNYTLKFVCDGFTSTQIFDITVLSGDTLELSTQNLTANNAPQNVELIYDTLNNRVTLNWDPIKRHDVIGYVVARKDNPLSVNPPVAVNANIIFDTTYTDVLDETLFSQEDSLTFKYFIQGVTETGYTSYSEPKSVYAGVVRGDTAGFTSFSIKEGDEFTGLTSAEVQWNYRGTIEWVKIYLSTDGGTTWMPISGGTIKNEGKFYWGKVNNVQSDNCMLRIEDVLNSNVEWQSERFTINRVAGTEIIENGRFMQGKTSWEPNIHDIGDPLVDGSFTFEDNMCKATVNSFNEEHTWKIRLLQLLKTQLYKQYTYELCIKGKAETPTEIHVEFFSGESDKYRWYAGKTITLGTEMKEEIRRIHFTEYDKVDLTEIDDPMPPQIYMSLNFGYGTGDYYIDEVSLRVVEVN